VLAEDLSDVTFLDGSAGYLDPVLAHRIRVTLERSQIEVECSLRWEITWN
jgi:hypothetical protein